MSQLIVNKLKAAHHNRSLTDISTELDAVERHALNNAPWPSYAYKPKVEFSIAHAADSIYLKYYVNEKSIRAAAGNVNGNVWEDACVEFFISFDASGYYNLEFNCIGTTLAAFGKDRNNRNLLPAEVINNIRYQSLIRNEIDNSAHWELTLAIPLQIFVHHSISSLDGIGCKVNFYKCGDKLPEPHFISWSNIQSEHPNFHLPQFFGTLVFE
jgi:hypothetical protein